MTRLRTAWIVARWEFTTTALRPSFLLVLVGLPVAHLAIAGLLGVSLSISTREGRPHVPIAVVDEHRLLADVTPGGDRVLRDAPAAIRALENGELDGVFVFRGDYLATGAIDIYERPARDLMQIGKTITSRERAALVIRRGLVPEASAGSREDRLVEPIAATTVYRVHGGTIALRTAPPIVDIFAGPFGVCFIMALSIFLASGLLQQAMATELQNRMLEVMLSVVTPMQLLTGKVFGLAAAGLVQGVVYLGLTAGATPLVGGVSLAWGLLAWSGGIFLAGYILFAVLMAGTGALARDSQEVPQLASLWMLLAAMPFFFITQITADAISPMARALTWFPPTAPVALLLRLTTGGVGVLERVAAIAAVLVFAALALRFSAALFGARVQSGGQITLKGALWN